MFPWHLLYLCTLKGPWRQNTSLFYSKDLVFYSTLSACLAANDALFTEKLNILSQNFNSPAESWVLRRHQWCHTGSMGSMYGLDLKRLNSMSTPCSIHTRQSNRNRSWGCRHGSLAQSTRETEKSSAHLRNIVVIGEDSVFKTAELFTGPRCTPFRLSSAIKVPRSVKRGRHCLTKWS